MGVVARRWVIVALVILAACGGRPEPAPSATVPTPDVRPEEPRPGGTVVVGILTDVDNWNPFLVATANAEDILALLYPTLAVEQVDYRDHPPSFEPNLAESWEFSADGLRLTFHIRPEATWSDGVPVSSRDVVFSWKARTSPVLGWGGAELEDRIASVEALDPRTVRFTFRHTYPYQLMDANDGPIVPAHAWEAIPFEEWERTDWAARTLSAGPFELVSHESQQQIVFRRNPRYWKQGRPYLERIVWRILPDQTNLLTQLKTGAIDLMEGIPPREAGHVRQHPRLELIVFSDRTYGYVGWNNRSGLFRDRRVRRALSLAIDRTTLLETVLRGFGRLGVGPVLSTMWAFNHDLQPLPFDPAEAVRLLAEAGWRDRDGDGVLDRRGRPFRFELLTNAGNEVREDMVVLIRDQLARVGIEVMPRFIEWGALISRLQRGDFDAYVSAWREATQVDLAPIWHSAPPGEPTMNWVGYANPEVDRLLSKGGRLPTIEAQKPVLDRIQELIVRDQPYTFLFEGERLDGLNRRVQNAVINDATPYFNVDEWWVWNDPS